MKNIRVYIETFGCQMNIADTERALSKLRQAGYTFTTKAASADVLLFNTCSVRARAEQKVFNRIGEIRCANSGREPLIGIMGCVAQLEGETLFDSTKSIRMVIGTRAIDRLPSIIERVREGEPYVLDLGDKQTGEMSETSLTDRHSKYIAFVPIIEGCNKFCSYCIVPFSRGREQSRPANEIISEIKRLHTEGYKEVHLIGQNVNSYRPKTNIGLELFEGATPFSRLLRGVASIGIPRIKFTTSFPRDFHQDILNAMDENENLCNWIHLPVQSGSDRILRSMRRGYRVSDYLKRVDEIKNAKRKYALTSDIIVGFPGETDQDFNETVKLVQRCQYHSLYIFKYSERKATPAVALSDNVSGNCKAERFSQLEEVQRGIQDKIYQSYEGTNVSVLVEGKSTRSPLDHTGHTTCNKVVNFRQDVYKEESLVGQIVSVNIIQAKRHSLYGNTPL